jgi:hypothetical protein
MLTIFNEEIIIGRSYKTLNLLILHLSHGRRRPELAGRVGTANHKPEKEGLGNEREDLVDLFSVEVARVGEVEVRVPSFPHVLLQRRTLVSKTMSKSDKRLT